MIIIIIVEARSASTVCAAQASLCWYKGWDPQVPRWLALNRLVLGSEHWARSAQRSAAVPAGIFSGQGIFHSRKPPAQHTAAVSCLPGWLGWILGVPCGTEPRAAPGAAPSLQRNLGTSAGLSFVLLLSAGPAPSPALIWSSWHRPHRGISSVQQFNWNQFSLSVARDYSRPVPLRKTKYL